MRSLDFRGKAHNRYWWFNIADAAYVPPVFAGLSAEEWSVMQAWFEDTERRFPSPGEISIPGISLLHGLIGGNAIRAIVQCGHYVGYSTLLLGFLLRGMGRRQALFSVDIDPAATAYTEGWVARAGLEGQLRLRVGNSSDPALPAEAMGYLGRAPQLVFIDSSHQYRHTLEELDLWYEALAPGGFLLLHDVSRFAQPFDSTGSGGVLRAAEEWTARRGLPHMLVNRFVDGSQGVGDLTYRDGCGIGLLQKPM